MRQPKSFLRVFTDTGPLAVLAVVIALLIGIAGPASAQFFNFGGFGGPVHGAADDLLARPPGQRRVGATVQQGFDFGAGARQRRLAVAMPQPINS